VLVGVAVTPGVAVAGVVDWAATVGVGDATVEETGVAAGL
jgi:hypothetical protein